MNDFMDHEQATLVKQPGDPVEEAATLPPSSPATEPASTAAKIGLPHLPGFLLEKELGRGGMGVVYLARQVRLNRLVALKMIISGDHANEETKLRFLAEAEAIAKLHHPGIVQVHEFGTHDNNPYFALEYISGGSLDKKLAGNPLPPREAADLVEKLARAVQSAHDAGIIHRDLKPANILLDTPSSSTGEGSGVRGSAGFAPKITDFGLVKNVGSDMTATGQILGTPSYMAPEQADGKKSVGPAADIYALGAILYECLTGRAPFKAATPLDTILQVVNDEPVSVRQLQAKTPMDLETICHKCLQKEPGKRYGTAAELAEDVGRYLSNEPIAARPVGRVEKVVRWCYRNRSLATSLFGIAAALLLGTSLSLWQAYRATDEANRANDAEQVAKDRANRITEEKNRADEKTEEVRKQKERAEQLLALQANREGLRQYEASDPYTGLLWFTQPFVITDARNVELMTRTRLGAFRGLEMKRTCLQHVIPQRYSVSNVTFSPDGRRLVIASIAVQSASATFTRNGDGVETSKVTTSIDQITQIYDTASGQPVMSSVNLQGEVLQIYFNTNTCLAIVASEKTTQVFDLASGKPVTPPINAQGRVHRACISPDGQRIVTVSQNIVQVWDTRSGKSVSPPLNHKEMVVSANFSPNGRHVVTASFDKTVCVWDSKIGKSIAPPMNLQNIVIRASFSPDGKRLVIASGNAAQLWDAISGKPATPPMNHKGMVMSASFSPDGRHLVTASRDKTARVWDATTGNPLSPVFIHDGPLNEAIFNPDGRRVVTVSEDKTVRVWDTGIQEPVTPPLIHQDMVYNASFSPDGHRVLTSSGKTAQVWDATSGKPVTLPFNHPDKVYSASFSPDGHRVLTSSGKTAQVWDTTSSKPVTPPFNHPDKVYSASFSLDGHHILTTSEDNAARVWDSSTGKPTTPPLKHRDRIRSASFRPDGQRVITTSMNNTVQLWDVASGKSVIPSQSLLAKAIDDLASFSPDGSRIVSASSNIAQVWDASSGQPITPPLNHHGRIQSAHFSPDSSYIVTVTDDNMARLWDASNGKPVTAPLIHHGHIHMPFFSPDSRCIVTASEDKTARVWDAATGQPVSPLLNHQDVIASALFSPNGRRILTASHDKTARLWDFPLETRPVIDLLRLAQVYASHKIDDTGGLQPLDVEKELIPWIQELKSKYPADFSITPQQARAWRENEIAQCMKEGNLPAAFFHRDWLIAEMVQEAAKSKK